MVKNLGENMRVCIVGLYPPHIGGVSSHTHFLSQELVKRGDEVFVVTYPHPDVKDVDGVKVKTAFSPNIRGLRGLFFILSATILLIRMVRRYKIDLIHAHFLLPPGLVGVLAGAFTGTKTVVSAHGTDLFIQAKNPILRSFIRFILGRADLVFIANETMKDAALNLGAAPEKIHLTQMTVDPAKFNPDYELPPDVELDPDKPTLFFLGNLVYQKGITNLLDAKKLLKNDCQLLIVGKGPLREELEEKVEKEGIENVKFLGFYPDVEKIMPSADIFVLPSISEGSPITILEAMASGLPVVATDVGGVKEAVAEDVGIVVEANDPVALSRAIDTLLDDADKRRKMGFNGRKKALEKAEIDLAY